MQGHLGDRRCTAGLATSSRSSVASYDNTGVPRGECKDCECSEFVGEQERDSRISGTCARCGCSSFRHKDISLDLKLAQALHGEVEEDWWGELERVLYLRSRGSFVASHGDCRRVRAAGDVAGPDDPVLVSVICPTEASRELFHPFMYACFTGQQYPFRELVVVETGDRPSEFFNSGPPKWDPRVTYRFFNTAGDLKWTIGTKRNVACYLAAGDVIVHFDDDDLYMPEYLSLMLHVLKHGTGFPPDLPVHVHTEAVRQAVWHGGALQNTVDRCIRCPGWGAELAKLSTWHTFTVRDGKIGVCDTSLHARPEEQRRWKFGFGFSFVYLWDAWRASWFKDRSMGEDSDLAEGFLSRGGRVALVSDGLGVCAHIHHTCNFSGWEPNREVRPTDMKKKSLRCQCLLLRYVALGLPLSTPPDWLQLTRARTVMTLEQALRLQDGLIVGLSDKGVQAQLSKVWKEHGGDLKKLARAEHDVRAPVVQGIVTKHGFVGPSGPAVCQSCFGNWKLLSFAAVVVRWHIVSWLSTNTLKKTVALSPSAEEELRDLCSRIARRSKDPNTEGVSADIFDHPIGPELLSYISSGWLWGDLPPLV